MKSRTQKSNFSSQSSAIQMNVRKPKFPIAICLENCQMAVTKGYEKFVLETLKAFSCDVEFQRKSPHLLNKQGGEMEKYFKTAKQNYQTEKIYSLDLKTRTDSKRMFYCEDSSTGIYKILALCSDNSHSS